ncbi:MAG: HDOD domain-containing protein [Proteobacteria bacterium]|nr:HDOD domain-containing protein [Pseudomonadota bacterium]HQR02635.1 HDOD domain-containing protein [Rhodocyclaceae bacterium]
MVEQAFADLENWTQYFCTAEVPVLRHTAQQLEKLRDSAETANARAVSSAILQDPLMTLRVLQYIERNRNQRQQTDITTIERALMMIGVEPFFRDFSQLPLIEDQLKPHPKALLGLLKVISRGRIAARWARDWAIQRHDLDVDEITVAALLRYCTDMLMWCFAPELALQARALQTGDRRQRSSVIQQETFNVRLDDLQMALVEAWGLPPLLITLMDAKQAENPRVRNVALACNLARHSANGWDDAALPDDYKAICELLRIEHETLMRKLGLNPEGIPL